MDSSRGSTSIPQRGSSSLSASQQAPTVGSDVTCPAVVFYKGVEEHGALRYIERQKFLVREARGERGGANAVLGVGAI